MRYEKALYKAKTDKEGKHSHRYGMLYDLVINSLLKGEKLSVLEIGVARGWSLLTYCQSGDFDNVVGVDVELRVSDQVSKELCKYKHSLHEMDAYSDEAVQELLRAHGTFDLIIDDGPHTFSSQKYFLKNYTKLLNENGLLLCEDVKRHYLWRFRRIKDRVGLYIIDLKQNRISLDTKHDDDIVILRRFESK